MNDPNGMVFYEDEFHLFYQHYPDSNVWGPMHWGHAVSKDLVKWENLPIALYPDKYGMICSGSAVVDWKNTSGFGIDDKPPLIAIFSYHNQEGFDAGRDDFQTQGIAYSNDNGRNWTKYSENPVVSNPGIRDFRDPKVIWYEESKKWVMVFARGDRAIFYNSENLKDWTMISEFGQGHGSIGRPWECPDLFRLSVGDTGKEKWVLLVSLGSDGPNGGTGTQYFIGEFDGEKFTNDNPKELTLWLDYGRDNYAGVTWSDIPEKEGRRIFIGWMSNWQYAQVVPTTEWRSAMTLPRNLKLINTAEGVRLTNYPIKEVEQLRIQSQPIKPTQVTNSLEIDLPFSPALSELVATISTSSENTVFGIELSNNQGEMYRIGFDGKTNQYFSDRTKSGDHSFSETFAKTVHKAKRSKNSRKHELRIILDVTSVELFADDGLTVMSEIFFPSEVFGQMKFFSEGGEVAIETATVYELRSIWE